MDWAVDATGLIITSGICCGQKSRSSRSVNDTSGGRSGTQSFWWVVNQTCVDPVYTPAPGCVVFQTFPLLSWTRNANQLCHHKWFQFRRCDAAAVQCGLETVLVPFVLSIRTPGTMMELSIEDLLRNSWVIHTQHLDIIVGSQIYSKVN